MRGLDEKRELLKNAWSQRKKYLTLVEEICDGGEYSTLYTFAQFRSLTGMNGKPKASGWDGPTGLHPKGEQQKHQLTGCVRLALLVL